MAETESPPIRKPPAYQEYAADVLANQTWRMMSLAERGLWSTLRMECWVNGKVPSDPSKLARLLNIPADEIASALTPLVLQFFDQIDDWLICPELENYRHELVARKRRISEGGRRGGETTQQRIKLAQVNKEAPLEATLEAPLEASFKPLRRRELIRGAVSGREKISLTTEQEEWAKKYDEAPEASEIQYGGHRG